MKIGYIILGILIGLIITYFLWGKPYSELKPRYEQLNQDYIQLEQKYFQLNQEYILLQQNYTQLSRECGEVLKDYQACIGRENFFTWVGRFSSLLSLAKFIGLISG